MKTRKNKANRIVTVLAIIAMISGLFPSVLNIQHIYADNELGWMSPVTSSANPNGIDYYVDATAGDDSKSGTSVEMAWKSLDKVNETVFQPGDRILFKADELWVGQLNPQGSGTAGNPIVIDQYGTGSKPRFEGRGQVDATVLLHNQSYWELYNLDVSNKAINDLNNANSLGDFRGIHITGDNGTQLQYFRLAGLNVHDVSGEVNWISGTIPSNPEPGINFKTGWDRSKRTGGIVFDTSVIDPANPGEATTLQDVVIENSVVQNTSFGNIIFKQYAGSDEDAEYVGWGERSSATDPRFTPHTDIIIRNNYLSQYDTNYGCNSIYLTGVRGAAIEGNIVAGAGTSGIELYYTDDVVIQYNEVYETKRKAGGADHNGIDPDKATTKAIIQYNYIHDTGDGILLCQFGFGDSIVRYNVIQNTERYPIYLHSDKRAVAEVYNNTIYNTKSQYMIYGYGSFVEATYNVYNNVFYSNRTNAVFTTGGNISYSNNSYYGASFPIPTEDTNAISIDPMLSNIGQGGKGTLETGPNLTSLIAYSPTSGSPLIGAGVEVEDNGGRDALGHALYNGTPDLGAIEYYGSLDSMTESITGKVIDTYGNTVANVKVELDVDGQTYEVSSSKSGYFALLNMPVGSGYTLTASKQGYHSSTLENIAISAGNTLSNVVIDIEPSTDFGAVSGIIRDGLGSPLAEANIVLSDGEGRTYSITSNIDGVYTINNVMTGKGYVLTAFKSGYRSAILHDIEVQPGHTASLPSLFLTGSHPIYLLQQDFEQIQIGSTPIDWTVSNSGGKISVVNDPGNAENRSLEIVRSSNSGSTSFSKSFAADELTGIVTVETNIMRDDEISSGASWVSVPYIYGVGDTSPSISFAFDKGKIKAYDAGAAKEILSYELGQWYNVQLVINLITQKFDLYIDGELKLEQAEFRRPMSDIGKIEYYANSSNYVEAYLDDIRIIRGMPYDKNDATLESLTIDQGELKKLSDKQYTVELPNYAKSVQVAAVAASRLVQSVSVNGMIVNDYEANVTIELEDGENDIEVVVTAEDGTMQSYFIAATVIEVAKDTSLHNIEVSEGQLSPAFNPEILEYDVVDIDEEAASIQIMAVANTSTATIEINGIEVASGQHSADIPLTGEMELIIKVISQDGTAYREYVLSLEHTAPETGGGEVVDAALPVIHTEPVSQTVKVGDTVKLDVEATANDDGELGYQWYRNDIENNSDGIAIEGATDSSYDAPTEDVGTTYYYVIVTNTNTNVNGVQTANISSAVVQVKVSEEVDSVTVESLTVTPATVELEAGETVELTVTATYSDETEEVVTEEASYSNSSEAVATVSEAGVITAVGAGTATITVEYEGEIITVAVKVKTKTDPVEPADKSALEATIAAVEALDEEAYTEESWSTVADVLIVAEKVLADDEATQTDVDSAVEELNKAVENLVEKARTEAPTWQEGSEVTASRVSSSSVTLTWNAVQNHTQVAGYKVIWTAGGEVKEQLVDGDTTSIRVTGLSSSTNYTFKVEAVDAAGNWSDTGPSITVTTRSSYVPPAEPQPEPTPEPETPVQPEQPVEPEQPTEPEQPIEPVQPQVEFIDVPTTHWAASAINRAAALGIVKGNPDHSFKPNSATTRAEFITMLANAFKWNGEQVELSFKDNDKIGGWAKEAIARGLERGVIAGYTDGSFRPNQEITRTEMIVMLARALGIAPSEIEQTGFVDDTAIPAWGKGAVEALREQGLLTGRSNNSFAPNESATRSEALVIILRALDLTK